MIGSPRTNRIAVLLQAMKQEPAPDTKCKDKFLVQSTVNPPEQDFASIPTIVSRVHPQPKIETPNQANPCCFFSL